MLERHHIVFKSQGGLDFELNYKYLTPEEHRGNNGPHLCRKVDLKYKKAMEKELRSTLVDDNYNIKEVSDILGIKLKDANRALRKLQSSINGISREDIIRRLMGGCLYL